MSTYLQMKIFCLLLFTCLLHLPSFAAVKGDPHHVIAFEGDLVFLRRTNASDNALVLGEKDQTLLACNNLVDRMKFDLGISAAAKLFATVYSTWELRFTGPFNWTGKGKVSSLER